MSLSCPARPLSFSGRRARFTPWRTSARMTEANWPAGRSTGLRSSVPVMEPVSISEPERSWLPRPMDPFAPIRPRSVKGRSRSNSAILPAKAAGFPGHRFPGPEEQEFRGSHPVRRALPVGEDWSEVPEGATDHRSKTRPEGSGHPHVALSGTTRRAASRGSPPRFQLGERSTRERVSGTGKP